MKMNEYQDQASETNIYPVTTDGLYAQVMGLCSEAGEVAGKMKKVIRDKHGFISGDMDDMLMSEIGDVLWYVSQLSFALGFRLSEVAEYNLTKLADRAERGEIGGSGDDR